MNESTKLPQILIDDYYRREQKKQKVCWALAFIGLSVWFADIYIGPNEIPEIIVIMGQIMAMASIVVSLITECPSCKRHNFRVPFCSVCKFPLIKPKNENHCI